MVLEWEGHHVVYVSTGPWTPSLSSVEDSQEKAEAVPRKGTRTSLCDTKLAKSLCPLKGKAWLDVRHCGVTRKAALLWQLQILQL